MDDGGIYAIMGPSAPENNLLDVIAGRKYHGKGGHFSGKRCQLRKHGISTPSFGYVLQDEYSPSFLTSKRQFDFLQFGYPPIHLG